MQTLAHLFSPSLHPLPFLKQLAAQQSSSLAVSLLKEEDPLLSSRIHYCIVDGPEMANEDNLRCQPRPQLKAHVSWHSESSWPVNLVFNLVFSPVTFFSSSGYKILKC